MRLGRLNPLWGLGKTIAQALLLPSKKTKITRAWVVVAVAIRHGAWHSASTMTEKKKKNNKSGESWRLGESLTGEFR